MIKKLYLIMCVLSLAGCSTNVKKDIASSEPEIPAPPPGPLVAAIDLIEKNNYVDAKKALDDYVDKVPANWSHRIESKHEARVFFWDKEQLAECGLFEIVASHGKKMEPVLDASYSKAYYLLAFIALESRNNPYRNALFNLNKGLELEPDQPTLLYEKANLYNRIKQPELAIPEYNHLINTPACITNVQKARAYRGLGEAFVALYKYDDAELALYESLKFDPDNKKAIAELDYIDQVRNLNVKN